MGVFFDPTQQVQPIGGGDTQYIQPFPYPIQPQQPPQPTQPQYTQPLDQTLIQQVMQQLLQQYNQQGPTTQDLNNPGPGYDCNNPPPGGWPPGYAPDCPPDGGPPGGGTNPPPSTEPPVGGPDPGPIVPPPIINPPPPIVHPPPGGGTNPPPIVNPPIVRPPGGSDCPPSWWKGPNGQCQPPPTDEGPFKGGFLFPWFWFGGDKFQTGQPMDVGGQTITPFHIPMPLEKPQDFSNLNFDRWRIGLPDIPQLNLPSIGG